DGQSYPGTHIFSFAMQALEKLKDEFSIFLLKANTVITHRNPVIILVSQDTGALWYFFLTHAGSTDINQRNYSFFGVFNGIAQQIGQELPELEWNHIGNR